MVLILSIHSSFIKPDVEGSGSICSIPIYAVFLTANKSNSLVTFASGIPYERLINWHKICSVLAVATAIFHLYASYVIGPQQDDHRRLHGGLSIQDTNALVGADPNLGLFLIEDRINTTGTIALASMIVLLLPSAVSSIRRWFFELWYFPHYRYLYARPVG